MKYIKEELEDLIFTQNLSYKEIGRRYDVSDTYIKKIANKLGISLKVRAKFPEGFIPANKRKYNPIDCLQCGQEMDFFGKKFCSRQCQGTYTHNEKYSNYLQNPNSIKYHNISTFKPDFLREQDSKCAICGMNNIWNDKPLNFILDHIDGRADNNTRNNLRLVCHNCDSQLDTYKSKNKNSDRKDRYLKNYKN